MCHYRGGSRISRRGAWTSDAGIFGENVCKNERIGTHRGEGVRWKILYVDPPMHYDICLVISGKLCSANTRG